MEIKSSSATVIVKKRERTQNWVPEEKTALFSLIKSHASAIENKKIDAAASAMKTLAWQQVHRSFRGRFSTERDITRMREQWRRMKAQARIEIYTFAEKVRTLGAEEAAKSRPSNLSIEVWRLMENSSRRDDEAELSDEGSLRDVGTEEAENFPGILDQLMTVSPPQGISIRGVKIENDSAEEFREKIEEISVNDIPKEGLFHRRKMDDGSYSEGNATTYNRKRAKVDEILIRNIENAKSEGSNETVYQPRNAEQNAHWIFDTMQKEHDIRLRMLKIELEKAEVKKQTALNELKTSEMKKEMLEKQSNELYSQVRMSGEPGSGAGKGGGGGGSIREAGGAFGKMEAAREDQYFYNKQKEQLNQLRESLHDEISFHEEQIKRHQEAIDRHKNRIDNMDKK